MSSLASARQWCDLSTVEVRIRDDMSPKGPARPMDWSDTVRHEDGSVTFEGEKKRSENWPQKASCEELERAARGTR